MDAEVLFIATKGAPEAVMDLCHFNSEQQTYWKAAMVDLAAQGLRVLAVAEAKYKGQELPVSEHDFDFKWVGLIGLADPIRAEVPVAMMECQTAGIRVVMITGDYPTTAFAIAKQAGMPLGKVISGDEIDLLTDLELQENIRRVNVCARISPQQKLRIVQALKHNGEIVTMTGDGVNDAPALRAAHVGIAMGLRGTDVAREASDLVLVDDNFASIVKGIRTGRRIFSNLQRSMAYIFAIHIPIAMLALIPMLFLLPPLFLPLHIALIEMIIDPACSLAFENEPEDSTCMTNAPRNTNAPLFGTAQMIEAFWQGLMVLGSALAAYFASTQITTGNSSAEHTRSMVIVAFVIANGFLIFISKSDKKRFWETSVPFNWAAVLISTGTVSLILISIYTPWISQKLRFTPLDSSSLFIAIGCGFLGLVVNQLIKFLKVAQSKDLLQQA
jgi:Ca2+-transporting ATPase